MQRRQLLRLGSASIVCASGISIPIRVGAAQAPEVASAGFAYAGAADSITARFPYSQRYEKAREAAGAPIGAQLFKALNATSPVHFKLVSQLDELKGRDQAIAVALVIGSETVSVEQFGATHKLLALVRGQATFFDFKSMNVLRSYPLSFAYVDVFDHAPTPAEIDSRIRFVYEGAQDKPGLLARYAQSVVKAELPMQVPRFLQVTAAQVKPDALQALPASLKAQAGAAETWAADMVSEALSTRIGIPIVPYAKGYAIGNVMSMRVSDGTVWELKLPTPDYAISTEIAAFKKILFNEVKDGATSFVYGAYAQIRIEEPLSGKTYLDTALKNGETRVIPASQKQVDDFPHYYDAVNGLFVKLALAIDGRGDAKWIKSAAAAQGIERQLSQTKALVDLCK